MSDDVQPDRCQKQFIQPDSAWFTTQLVFNVGHMGHHDAHHSNPDRHMRFSSSASWGRAFGCFCLLESWAAGCALRELLTAHCALEGRTGKIGQPL